MFLAEKRRYPIGIQTYKNIVEGSYPYIDKPGFVYVIAEDYKYVFLSRPRRFGKSLLSSTIHSYFEGETIKLVKIGVNISTEARTLESWEMTEE